MYCSVRHIATSCSFLDIGNKGLTVSGSIKSWILLKQVDFALAFCPYISSTGLEKRSPKKQPTRNTAKSIRSDSLLKLKCFLIKRLTSLGDTSPVSGFTCGAKMSLWWNKMWEFFTSLISSSVIFRYFPSSLPRS